MGGILGDFVSQFCIKMRVFGRREEGVPSGKTYMSWSVRIWHLGFFYIGGNISFSAKTCKLYVLCPRRRLCPLPFHLKDANVLRFPLTEELIWMLRQCKYR